MFFLTLVAMGGLCWPHLPALVAGQSLAGQDGDGPIIEDGGLTIEAEHYNFGAGKFINNPEFSYEEGPSNYLYRVAVEGVDTHQISTNGMHLFRPFDAVGIDLSGDVPRPVFEASGVDDYSVGWITAGEWLNYTRVFNPGYYQVYARAASPAGEPIQALLEEVVSGSSSGLQTLAPLGGFCGRDITDADYHLIPLTDGLGHPLVVKLAGQRTVRITARSENFLFNYLYFMPVADPGILPPVATCLYPQPEATGVMPDVTLDLVITDRDTQVVPSSLRLFLNQQEVSEAALVQDTDYGIRVRYQSPALLPFGQTNTVRLIFGDNATPPFAVTNEWTFVTVTNVVTLPENLAYPSTYARQRGLTVHMVQGPVDPILSNTVQRAEEQLAGQHIHSGVLVPTESESLTSILVANHAVNPGDSEAGIKHGNFGGDQSLLGLGGHTRNLSAEIVAYLMLNRGTYRFGINSDDGFRLTVGRLPADTNLVLGAFEGTREAADTQFDFLVLTNGLYAFRLVWEQGSEDGSFEWFSVDRQTGARTLIDDTTVPGAILAYRLVAGVTAPVGFAQQPEHQGVIANQPASFAVAVTNAIPNPGNVYYQWQVNGTDIAGANRSTYAIAQASLVDNGSVYRCLVTVPGYNPLISADAVLTVTEDNLPPSALRAVGGRTLDSVTISFSEPMDPGAAQDPAHYTLSGGVAVTAAALDASGTNVILSTATQAEGTRYTVTLNGLADTTGLPLADGTTLTFTSYAMAVGFIQRELYLDIPGTEVLDLESTDKYALGQYDSLTPLALFEAPTHQGDHYGQKISGYLLPPVSGNYLFYIASDDNSELRLSPSTDPLAKTTLASVSGNTDPRQWDKYPATQGSAPIPLEAGQRYYIEAVHKQGTDGDHLAVGWTLPDQTGLITVISGQYLASFVNPDEIEAQPPTLNVARQQTNLVLSWSVANGGYSYALETVGALPSTHWTWVTQPVMTNGSAREVTVPILGGQSYYRLRR
jgi:hypothetical protein